MVVHKCVERITFFFVGFALIAFAFFHCIDIGFGFVGFLPRNSLRAVRLVYLRFLSCLLWSLLRCHSH